MFVVAGWIICNRMPHISETFSASKTSFLISPSLLSWARIQMEQGIESLKNEGGEGIRMVKDDVLDAAEASGS